MRRVWSGEQSATAPWSDCRGTPVPAARAHRSAPRDRATARAATPPPRVGHLRGSYCGRTCRRLCRGERSRFPGQDFWTRPEEVATGAPHLSRAVQHHIEGIEERRGVSSSGEWLGRRDGQTGNEGDMDDTQVRADCLYVVIVTKKLHDTLDYACVRFPRQQADPAVQQAFMGSEEFPRPGKTDALQ